MPRHPATKTPPAEAPEAELTNHRVVARRLGFGTTQFRQMVARGQMPLPHSYVGCYLIYRVKDVDHYIETGRWPAGAKFQR